MTTELNASLYEPVSAAVNLPAQERDVLAWWDAEKTFEATLEKWQ